MSFPKQTHINKKLSKPSARIREMKEQYGIKVGYAACKRMDKWFNKNNAEALREAVEEQERLRKKRLFQCICGNKKMPMYRWCKGCKMYGI